MNWYSLYKQSEPLVEENEYDWTNYIEIGHSSPDDILWFIDTRYIFHSIKKWELEDEIGDSNEAIHFYWMETLGVNFDNVLYTGRYDQDTGKASMLSGGMLARLSIGRQEYTKNRVLKILDTKLNNPTIIGYT